MLIKPNITMCCSKNNNKAIQSQAIATPVIAEKATTVIYSPVNPLLIENVNQLLSKQINYNLNPDTR